MLSAYSKQLSSSNKTHNSSKQAATVQVKHSCKLTNRHTAATCSLTFMGRQQQLPASPRAVMQPAVMQPGTATTQQHRRADAIEKPWRLYTCRMPLIGLEGIASALEGTSISGLLQLHTYLLLKGPDQVSCKTVPTAAVRSPTAAAAATPATAARVVYCPCIMLPRRCTIAQVPERNSSCAPVHCMILLPVPSPTQAGVWYLDFLPINPTAPSTGLLLLSGGRAPGQ